MRQVAISHYIKAWDTGQVFYELDPVRMHWSSRCAAARTCSIMFASEAGAGAADYLLPFAGAEHRHLRGSTTPLLTLYDGHSPLATTPRADKTFGFGGNAEYHGERSIPRRAACIATCVDFILIPFSFALNP